VLNRLGESPEKAMMKQASREMSGDVVNGPGDRPPALEVRLFGITRREAGGYLIGAVLLAVLLAASGAFDSDEIALAHRFGLWLVVAVLGVGQTLVLDGLIAPRLPGRFFAGAAAAAGVIALMTLELHALKYTPLLPYPPDPLLEFAAFLAPPIGAIAAIVILTRVAAPDGLAPRLALSGPQREPAQLGYDNVIAGYLPAPTALADWPSAPVLWVRADDHYLEVATAAGRRFLRGRMKDALRRLGGAEGLQPHRSWWVARSKIARVRRQGRDYVIETRDGVDIPVARARVSMLKALGLV
jgi:hypothetical protein